jgi:hypothetical protein
MAGPSDDEIASSLYNHPAGPLFSYLDICQIIIFPIQTFRINFNYVVLLEKLLESHLIWLGHGVSFLEERTRRPIRPKR